MNKTPSRLPRSLRKPSISSKETSALLELLREKDFKSMAEIRKSSGLPPREFAAAVGLLKKKRLVERTNGRMFLGRRSECLQVRADCGYVAAVDIGGTNLRLVVADMAGAIVGKWMGSTVGASSPGQVVQLIRKGVKQIQRQRGVREGTFLAIAAGAPGVTDSKNGVVLLTSYLGGWKDVPLGKLLEDAFGAPAVIENDVRLGAMGERWKGSARGLDNFVFLAIGTGIAAGICVNGELLHGPEFAAGEVGYLVVPGTPEVGVREGTPGPLESVIGGEGIKAQWRQFTQRMYGEALSDLSATDIFDRAMDGDEHARRVLDRTAKILAHAVYNISVVLNCPHFILGGGVGTSAILRDAAESVLQSYTEPARPKLSLSSLGPEAQLIGAVRLALDAAEKRIGIRA
jgi:glucokinase